MCFSKCCHAAQSNFDLESMLAFANNRNRYWLYRRGEKHVMVHLAEEDHIVSPSNSESLQRKYMKRTCERNSFGVCACVRTYVCACVRVCMCMCVLVCVCNPRSKLLPKGDIMVWCIRLYCLPLNTEVLWKRRLVQSVSSVVFSMEKNVSRREGQIA